MLRSFSLSIFCIFIGGLAHSDDLADAIQAYNVAQQSGNAAVKINAARNLGAAAMAAPERDDTPLLVFEAANTLIVQGSTLDASEMANWLESVTTDDRSQIDPANVDVLINYVRWVENPNKSNRQSLDQALLIMEPLQPTLLSLVVFQNRYAADLEKGNSRAVVASAGATAIHLEPAKDVIGEIWSNAVIVAHAHLFNSSTSHDALFEMARHEIALRQMHAQMHAVSSDHPGWIDKHMALAETWRMAMEAYYDSDRSESASKRARRQQQVDQILDWESPDFIRHDDDEADQSQLPFCAGEFDMIPELKYPRRAARKGRVGAVMLSVDVEDGRVSNAEVLAAIPHEGFTDEVIETVKKWTWVVDADTPQARCRLDAQDIRWPFVFTFED